MAPASTASTISKKKANQLAIVVLLAGSWLGMQAATPWVGRIPDKLHAKIYLTLLTLVLLTMAL